MRVLQWSSQSVPDHQQFDCARALLLDSAVPIRLERPAGPSDRPFQMTAELHAFGHDLTMSRNAGEAAVGLRGSAEIARGSPDSLWALSFRTTAGTMMLNGRPYFVEPGDVLFGDCGVQQRGDGAPYVEFDMWMMPRSRVAALLAKPSNDPVGHLKFRTPLGRLVSNFAGDLAPALTGAGTDAEDKLIDTFAGLLAAGAGASSHASELVHRAGKNARLAAIQRDIARNHRDPALDPPSLARRHSMSLRALHLLFEPTGKSCARTLNEARLATAYRRLLERGPSTVADIAFGSGFESLSTFYRSFRAHYGHGPGELRFDAARGARPDGRRRSKPR